MEHFVNEQVRTVPISPQDEELRDGLVWLFDPDTIFINHLSSEQYDGCMLWLDLQGGTGNRMLDL